MPDNRKPLIYGAFPVCRNYTVRAQLRQPAAEEWRPHEADPGVAGAQRLQHDRQHLRPPGCRVQAHLSTGNGKGIGDELRSPYRIRVSEHGGRPLERDAGANEKGFSRCGGKPDGGEGGIRTHGPVISRFTRFRVGAVMTASILLQNLSQHRLSEKGEN